MTLSFADGQLVRLQVQQLAAGSGTMTFGTVTWIGGAPTITTTASKRDLFLLWRDGSEYFGAIVAQGY